MPKPFIEVSSQDLITQLHMYEGQGSEFAQEHSETINTLLQYIDMKLESDNSVIHLIVLN